MKSEKDLVIERIKNYKVGKHELAYGLIYGPNYDLTEPLGLVSSKKDTVVSIDPREANLTGIYYIRHGLKGNLIDYSFLGKRMDQEDFLNFISSKKVRPELKGELDDMDTYLRTLYEMGREPEVDVVVPIDEDGTYDFRPYLEGDGEKVSKIRYARKKDSIFNKPEDLISRHVDIQEMLKQFRRVTGSLQTPLPIFEHDDEENDDIRA